MKHIPLLILIFFLFAGSTLAQDRFSQDFTEIQAELESWDPVRGKWLGASWQSMANDQSIPDRTFPEDFTPGEMWQKVPADRASRIEKVVATNAETHPDLMQREKWRALERYTRRPSCAPTMGRSYGDPHLETFDGEKFSFQTVGEFVMVRSLDGRFEVQSRQRPEGSDFSLNSAVAANLDGDRIGIYTNNMPDGSDADVRVNGRSIYLDNQTYYLPRGGTIRKSGKNYLITSPTGERFSVDRRAGRNGFLDMAIHVFPCSRVGYEGVLGNANGDRSDDFSGRESASNTFGGWGNDPMSREMEQRRLEFLSREFANRWRVTAFSSLFEYRPGENTMTFTDYNFPRVHRTVHDLPNDRRSRAERACRQMGLTGRDLEACIFDQGYLEIPPTPRPVIKDPSRDIQLGRVEREVPNVNPRETRPIQTEEREIRDDGQVISKPMKREDPNDPSSGGGALPIDKEERKEHYSPREEGVENESGSKVESKEPVRSEPETKKKNPVYVPPKQKEVPRIKVEDTPKVPVMKSPVPPKPTPTPPTRTKPTPTKGNSPSTPAPTQSAPVPIKGGGLRGG